MKKSQLKQLIREILQESSSDRQHNDFNMKLMKGKTIGNVSPINEYEIEITYTDGTKTYISGTGGYEGEIVVSHKSTFLRT